VELSVKNQLPLTRLDGLLGAAGEGSPGRKEYLSLLRILRREAEVCTA